MVVVLPSRDLKHDGRLQRNRAPARASHRKIQGIGQPLPHAAHGSSSSSPYYDNGAGLIYIYSAVIGDVLKPFASVNNARTSSMLIRLHFVGAIAQVFSVSKRISPLFARQS